ncbi:ATP-binding protein [Allonocardiopsis opalescens]|uniref:Histidine kinase-like protein n=1 Tax=Allonocardiopsis opalescens TaxID=1144618 RepID=A0A2T0Q9T8_9ACTN|nr:ATP-binding protein [Allonocardiopsis opalescens]PRY00659.1 histidine kinase-like protein [Allonocardiopsis opalescens]
MIAAVPGVVAPAGVTSMQEFPGEPESVHEARDWLYGELNAEHAGLAAVPESVVHLAVLLVSELAANAVQHSDSFRTGGMFDVQLERLERQLRVAVADEGPADGFLPHVVHADEGDAESGRGLRVVAEMSAAHGYHYGSGGTTVYFDLAWGGYDCDDFSVPRRL